MKVECNNCGAGKTRYWIKKYEDRSGVLEEDTIIKSQLNVKDLDRECPKCGENSLIPFEEETV
jgi:ribosomal protein S27AE